MKRRYHQVTFEAGRFSDWVILRHAGRPRVHMVGCCDCGLVHASQYEAWVEVKKNGKITGYRKLVRVGRYGTKESLRVVIASRHKVDKRATAGKRRAKKFRRIRKAL